MKQTKTTIAAAAATVAPRAGAWIETVLSVAFILRKIVAPRAGAWIETRLLMKANSTKAVAPRAGAWIETSICKVK